MTDLTQASDLELRFIVDAALLEAIGFDDLSAECLRRAQALKANREEIESGIRRNRERISREVAAKACTSE